MEKLASDLLLVSELVSISILLTTHIFSLCQFGRNCWVKISVVRKMPHNFGRIPYMPFLNSKAALLIILSLSSAAGDLGLLSSVSSFVKVSLC